MMSARICPICGQANCGDGAPPRYAPLSLERKAIPMHTLKQDTYVDIDGNVVERTDPKVQTVVGLKGAQISEDDARRYGLVGKRAEVEHDEASDPDNAADPVVGGVPAPDGDPAKQGKAKK